MLKVARASLAFSAFLWAHFVWKLSYCDSCPLPVRITSPGNGSSSRAHRSPWPTPSPLEPPMLLYRLFRRLLVQVCHFFRGKTGERSYFLPDFSSPAVVVFPQCSSCGFCNRSAFLANWETHFFPLHVLVYTGPGTCAALSPQESRRLATLLCSEFLPEYTEIREQAIGERRKGSTRCWWRPENTSSKNCRLLSYLVHISRLWLTSSSFSGWVWVVNEVQVNRWALAAFRWVINGVSKRELCLQSWVGSRL